MQHTLYLEIYTRDTWKSETNNGQRNTESVVEL